MTQGEDVFVPILICDQQDPETQAKWTMSVAAFWSRRLNTGKRRPTGRPADGGAGGVRGLPDADHRPHRNSTQPSQSVDLTFKKGTHADAHCGCRSGVHHSGSGGTCRRAYSALPALWMVLLYAEPQSRRMKMKARRAQIVAVGLLLAGFMAPAAQAQADDDLLSLFEPCTVNANVSIPILSDQGVNPQAPETGCSPTGNLYSAED
ncbi:hypothetical protein [Streptomyces flavidovirens]|uniref:Uncharacterized protein n=1 Tax=Streptomyces flavidovirens TaxID=67298 RepID=A0ABW6RPY6_9ACTN